MISTRRALDRTLTKDDCTSYQPAYATAPRDTTSTLLRRQPYSRLKATEGFEWILDGIGIEALRIKPFSSTQARCGGTALWSMSKLDISAYHSTPVVVSMDHARRCRLSHFYEPSFIRLLFGLFD